MRKTKIIATIGPACEKPAVLEKIIKAGVDVCRLNFSFGSHEEHGEKIRNIRAIAAKLGKSVAIMQDLQGPKIRIGILRGPVTVKHGDEIILSGNSRHQRPLCLPTTYRNIAADTQPQKIILLADGRIILQVKAVFPEKREVVCKVLFGGVIASGKGINLPYTKISLPAVTPKDAADAVFGIRAGVDYLALSFVRTPRDIMKLKKILRREHADIPIIAKLEKPEALDNLDAILDVADGVMVARGDLADEISFEKVPGAQKRIIAAANRKNKLAVIATEMLSSMVQNPLPTRAEVSDVANGVLDGADLVMLSNETATGTFPEKAVKTMAEIVAEAETLVPVPMSPVPAQKQKYELPEAMCRAASFLSYELAERAMVVLTTSGETARMLSKSRPDSTIFAATYCESTYYRMAAYHNVIPLLLHGEPGPHENATMYSLLRTAKTLEKKKYAKRGDRMIVLTGRSGAGRKWRLNAISTLEMP